MGKGKHAVRRPQPATLAIHERALGVLLRIPRLKNYIIHKLTNKDAKQSVLTFAAHWRLPWLAAYVLTTVHKRLLPRATVQSGRNSRRILILNSGKDEFFRDLEETFRDDTTFDLYTWPNYVVPLLAGVFLGRSLKHNTYLTNDPAIEAAKIKYRKFHHALWRYHQLLRPVDAVISPNFGYLYQREMAAALERRGTPFIVMQKENLNAATEERRRVWHALYKEGRGKFGGRRILVYNEMERDLEVASGVVDPERVEIVGMPRLDRFHRWRRERANANSDGDAHKVLFFFFARSDKLPKESGLGKDWGEFCADTHRAMIELARSRPDLEIVAKTKGIARQNQELLQALKSGGKKPPSNFRTVSGGDAFQLITASRVVVGFNTTALIEALALGKPVIVPRYGEARDPDLQKFIIDLGDAVEYADSPRELKEMVAFSANQPAVAALDLKTNARKILKYWLGNDDGEAGRRAYHAIWQEVMRS